MDERSDKVLRGLVGYYIDTGLPASSAALAEYLELNVSPATIRHVLHELNKAGYVEQPHTSAGRVPTDAGYRYYVNTTMSQPLAFAEQRRIQQAFNHLYRRYRVRSRTVASLLARLSRAIVISVDLAEPDIQEAGLRQQLRQLDSRELNTLREISVLLEALERRLTKLAALTEASPAVYIGRENPFLRAEHTSVIVKRTRKPSGLLIIAGPKRMAYPRNVALLNYIAHLSSNQHL